MRTQQVRVAASQIHTDYCAGAVNYLPTWLAPNLITLIGIAGLVAAYLTTLYYLPGLAGVPNCDCVTGEYFLNRMHCHAMQGMHLPGYTI